MGPVTVARRLQRKVFARPIEALPDAIGQLRRSTRARLLDALERAEGYEQWVEAALQHDRFTGRDRWREREVSALYDHALIGERLAELRALGARGDLRGQMFAIEDGVHGNLGGMGRAVFYRKARFGTKRLIGDYVQAVADTLLAIEAADERELPRALKLDLFRRASRCCGRTALMMSSGGTLMYFHFGVARALFEQGVLPDVLSGSSAGAIVAAVFGTHTDAELRGGLLEPASIYFGEHWEPSRLERVTRLRRIYGTGSFDQTFERLIPDLTFREAFELTGRNISVSVSPCERHQSPRLLNAITSPHVLIRSAVRASCAIPGLFEPVQLMARDPQGRTVPFLKAKWIDGVFAADLPARQLARIYGTNHYIVSYVNPVLLATFRDHRLQSSTLEPMTTMMKGVALNLLKSSDRLLGKYLPASQAGVANKVLRDMLSQTYVGDISITPRQRIMSPHRLMSPYSQREIGAMMLEGSRETWPRIEMIRNCSTISRTLDAILRRAGEGSPPPSGSG